MKGWMQTWLVHMRRPVRCARQLGWHGFLGFNLIGAGMLVSAMIHPIYLITLVAMATDPLRLWGDGGLIASMVVGVNLFNLCAGYLAFLVLAKRALALRGRTAEARVLILLPVYWLLMSLASYRAIVHLVTRPHHWDKTAHPARTAIAPAVPLEKRRPRRRGAMARTRNRGPIPGVFAQLRRSGK